MFARAYSTIFCLFIALPLLAAATPTGVIESRQTGQCNVGSLQCCNQVQQANPIQSLLIGGLLGIVLGPLDGVIGLSCSPISVVGVGGNSCNANPVCCSNNVVGGIGLGCVPLNLGL